MTDHMTPEQRSRAMKSVKLRNGSLELVVQRQLELEGLRFHCHDASLPGTPDIVFPKERVAVFVDGDFWHGWRLPAWEQKLSDFWRQKLWANRARDQRNFRRLRSTGWKVIRVWQHELTQKGEAKYIMRIRDALDTNRAHRRRRDSPTRVSNRLVKQRHRPTRR